MSKVTYVAIRFLLLVLVLLHVWVAPYTKVEESFNIQAVHDILEYGIPTQNAARFFKAHYDHMTFPGAVPRSFVGALVLAGVSKPLTLMDVAVNKQILVRAALGFFNASAILSFASRVKRAFGQSTAIWYLFFQASQFHVIFYASRPLPNMFAFGLSTIALGNLIPQPVPAAAASKRYKIGLILLTVAGIVLRSELALLLFSYVAVLFARGQVSLRRELIPAGLTGVLLGLGLTISIDTFFWQSSKPLWPELTAFLSNVFPEEGSEGASAWGTSPWYWYFVSALPRLLMNPLMIPLIATSFLLPSTRRAASIMLIPNFLFISAYSLLPHKETRFVMYTVPVLTLCAALPANYLWTRGSKNFFYRLASLVIISSTLLTAAISHILLLPISSLNYPGGQALQTLHEIAHNTKAVINVHLDNLSLQTGVTHFQEMPAPNSTLVQFPGSSDGHFPSLRSGSTKWIYDKTEDDDLKLTPEFWEKFDYVIAEHPGRIIGLWDVVGTTKGFGGVRILKPGMERNEASGTTAALKAMYGDLIGSIWNASIEGIRETGITKGWWPEVYLADKLYILKRDTTVSE